MSSKEKIWFIRIDGKREGPFSFEELKNHPRITPDTFVWRRGLRRWMPIKRVRELKKIFEDETEPPTELTNLLKFKKPELMGGKDILILNDSRETPPLLFWILVTILVVSYLLYKLSERS